MLKKLKTPLEKKALYIQLAIATILLPIVYYLGIAFMDNIVDVNGHGIDGIGAALAAALIFNIVIRISIVIYAIMVLKIIISILHYKEISNALIIVPFMPIIITLLFSIYNNSRYESQLNKERAAYTVESYVSEVKERKKQDIHNVDGQMSVYAYTYISTFVASDNYWLSTRLQLKQSERKAIIDEAIPILMKDLESENLCYCKHFDSADHYYPTTIEYWEYHPESDTLVVKFANKEDPKEFKIEYFDIAGTG